MPPQAKVAADVFPSSDDARLRRAASVSAIEKAETMRSERRVTNREIPGRLQGTRNRQPGGRPGFLIEKTLKYMIGGR